MTKQIIDLSWEYVIGRLDEINSRRKGQTVYGIPKGGMIAAGFLNDCVRVYDPYRADFFLDDIYATGRTVDFYAKHHGLKEWEFVCTKSEFPQPSWVLFPWEADHPGVGDQSIADNVVRIISFIGEDITREGLVGTPNRVVKSWKELYSGYNKKVEDILTVFEPDGYDQMVYLNNIELYSMCEHHMLPFYGKAHVAYIPDKKVVGISKLARLVDIYARRLQIQERLGEQITDALMEHLKPKGAACVIEASHMCMRMRGVNKQNSVMVTSSLKGAFKNNEATRLEFFSMIKHNGK